MRIKATRSSIPTKDSTSLVWNDGVGSFESSEPFVRYERKTCPQDEASCLSEEGPYKDYHLGIQINDGENGRYLSILADSDLSSGAPRPYYDYGNAKLIWGRFVLNNIFGASVDPLAIEGKAEYWNGSKFVINTDDSCTVFTGDDFNDDIENDDLDVTPQLASGAGTTLVKGELLESSTIITEQFAWLAPESLKDSDSTGSFTFELVVPPYLQYEWDNDKNDENKYQDNPTAEGTFGIYRGSDRQIYWQEVGW